MANTVTHMTRADWLAQVQACGGDMTQSQLIDLIYKDGPNAIFNDMVNQNHMQMDGMDAYFRGMFPTVEWSDWQGIREVGTIYHNAFIPFDMGVWRRTMQICSPGDANECHTDFCTIPQGGISHLPEMEMYRTGVKTEPFCIANIRTSRQALQLAERIVNERFAYDEMLINSFYTMAAIRMLGHKWVLSYTDDVNGNPIPTPNSNPYNALQGYSYNYMEPLFPQPPDLDKILPMDLRFLDQFGRALTNSQNPNFIAKGPRGEPIFMIWYPEDWYRTEILDLPEYKELMKYTMKVNLLPGYTNVDQGQEKEVIGNFAMRQMTQLPRFAESTTGGLTVIQDLVPVAVDSGSRALYNYRQRDNAPFGMALCLGKGLGNIVTRPTLSTGVEGRPIMPIGGSLTGNESWIYRNPYDKECNPQENMPWFEKRVEIGFKQTNPDAGWGFIFAMKNFRVRPTNICDLRPKMVIAPVDSTCNILQIGCNPKNVAPMAGNNIITSDHTRTIQCQAVMCGINTIYRLEFTRQNADSIAVDQNPLPCVCGDHVDVIVNSDTTGTFVAKVDGTLVSYERPNLHQGPVWYVQLGSPLSTGQCIHAVVCVPNNNDSATVTECQDHTDDSTLANTKLRLTVDSLLDVSVGDTVVVRWKNLAGSTIGTLHMTVSIINEDDFIYTLTSTGGNILCSTYADTETIVVSTS